MARKQIHNVHQLQLVEVEVEQEVVREAVVAENQLQALHRLVQSVVRGVVAEPQPNQLRKKHLLKKLVVEPKSTKI
jgi:hypothetical protein